MRSTKQHETDRVLEEVTLFEVAGGEWDELQLHRGPVRHLVAGDDGSDQGEQDGGERASCCGGRPADEDSTGNPAASGHCH